MNGFELKKLREEYRLTQDELANATGLRRGTIANLEATGADIKKADVLNALIQFFFKEKEKERMSPSSIKTIQTMDGFELKKLREKHGLTQSDIASITGLSCSSIARIETLGNTINKISVLYSLNKFFNKASEPVQRESVRHRSIFNGPEVKYKTRDEVITGMTTVIDAKDELIKNLKESNDQLLVDNRQLRMDNIQLRSDNQQLRVDNSQLRKDIDHFRTSLDKLRANMDKLREENEKLRENNLSLREEHQRQQQVEKLKTELVTIKGEQKREVVS